MSRASPHHFPSLKSSSRSFSLCSFWASWRVTFYLVSSPKFSQKMKTKNKTRVSMEAATSRQVEIFQVAEVKRSDIHGYGLFARVSISSGTYLSDLQTQRSFLSYCNDADFAYPADWSKISESLQKYQTLPKSDWKCNIIPDAKRDKWKTSRCIEKGEEITKHYGLLKWTLWLTLDLQNRAVANKGKHYLEMCQSLQTALDKCRFTYHFPLSYQEMLLYRNQSDQTVTMNS